jgi:hypothetical protein
MCTPKSTRTRWIVFARSSIAKAVSWLACESTITFTRRRTSS